MNCEVEQHNKQLQQDISRSEVYKEGWRHAVRKFKTREDMRKHRNQQCSKDVSFAQLGERS